MFPASPVQAQTTILRIWQEPIVLVSSITSSYVAFGGAVAGAK